MNDKLDKLRDALNEFMSRLSETNPRYPEYGYAYEDGKIIEVKLLGNLKTHSESVII